MPTPQDRPKPSQLKKVTPVVGTDARTTPRPSQLQHRVAVPQATAKNKTAAPKISAANKQGPPRRASAIATRATPQKSVTKSASTAKPTRTAPKPPARGR